LLVQAVFSWLSVSLSMSRIVQCAGCIDSIPAGRSAQHAAPRWANPPGAGVIIDAYRLKFSVPSLALTYALTSAVIDN